MTQALTDKLAAVRAKFRQSLPGRLDELDALIPGCVTSTGDGLVPTKRIHRILHEISGNAGLLGERAVAAELAPAFRIAETCAGSERVPSLTELRDIEAAVRNARACLDGEGDEIAVTSVPKHGAART